MLRLGVTEKAITELVAIGEHVVGVSVGAAGFRLDAQHLVAPVESDTAESASQAELESAIRTWAHDNLAVDGLPTYWRILRDEPQFRDVHWRVHKLVLSAGEIDAKAKALIAFAVASYRTSDYWIEYFARYCRVAFDVTDKELREAVLAGVHSAGINTVAHGMMLNARFTDMRAEDFHEHK